MEHIYEADCIEICAIEFIDDAERLEKISDFVGRDIRVDYSGSDPVLRIDNEEFHVGDFVAIHDREVCKVEKSAIVNDEDDQDA